VEDLNPFKLKPDVAAHGVPLLERLLNEFKPLALELPYQRSSKLQSRIGLL
jgi:hypothetical protein